MNQEIKKQWVEALRSGEFKQGHSALCRKGNFCCLGVLTELGHRAGIVSKHPDADDFGDIAYGEKREWAGLPDEIMKWADLDSKNVRLISDEGKTGLDCINDNGASFEKIAALIEEQL